MGVAVLRLHPSIERTNSWLRPPLAAHVKGSAYVRHRVARRAKLAALDFNGDQIMNTQLLQQARVLDIDEHIELVEAIWDGIVSRGAVPPLTEAQKTELDRRLADHLANPHDVVPWSEVKAAALAKIRP